MSVDKLVDSTQLDSDLTSVANAIRTKGGTSASISFPAGFVSAINAIPTGGGITVTNYSLLSQDTIDFNGPDSDLFSASSGGMSIATVPIYIAEYSAQYQFTCFGAESGSAVFGSLGDGNLFYAEFMNFGFGSGLVMSGVMALDGIPLTASLGGQMTVYSV